MLSRALWDEEVRGDGIKRGGALCFSQQSSATMSPILLLLLALAGAGVRGQGSGILYPRDSESRQTKSLDGIWTFRYEPQLSNQGLEEEWYARPLSEVSHPASCPTTPL
jgi:hypothetical protein